METLFFFIDESASNTTKIASLTAIIIQQSDLFRLRKQFFEIYKKIIYKITPDGCENRVIMMPPELHGNNFMQVKKNDQKTKYFETVTDDFRIEILEDIVDYINSNNIKVYRWGYTHKDKVVQDLNTDHDLYSELFLAFNTLLNHYAKCNYVIPIMDSVNPEKLKFITCYPWKGICYSEIYPELTTDNLFMSNSSNFMLSTVFANSEHNEFIQLADILAYLFHKKDLKVKNQVLSNFAERLINVLDSIDEKLIIEKIATMDK